jgi:outer membrane receptor protein involved in Fe transport
MIISGRRTAREFLRNFGSPIAIAVMLTYTGHAAAQIAPSAEEVDSTDQAAAVADVGEIVITGSRIEKLGFDQPTPTTVIGATELREGARSNIQQVLTDLPQVRPTTVPQNSNGNVNSSGTAPVDLRGLGNLRTLTLLNGRRFIGDNNLNFVPFNLVGRVEVVTGGASAAYGSGAVAGVVNIILNEKLEGISLGAQSGISSRGDGQRIAFDGTFGTGFADGRGRFIAGFEYVDDKGIGPGGRPSRPFLGAGAVRVNPLNTALDRRTQIVPDVNFGNTAIGGLITSGVLAGQIFNPDGTLRPFLGGTQVVATAGSAFNTQMMGGADGTSQYDNIYLNTPVKRATAYARASFDLGGAKIWADASYGRSESNYPFLYDPAIGAVTISVNNAYLPAAARNQMVAANQTSFTLGRYFVDAYTLGLESLRQSYEGAVGIEGSFGEGRFRYSAHYSHGEMTRDEALTNARIAGRYTNAINSVLVNGTPVCAINADANPANDDAACTPINPFGFGNVSDAAKAYTTGSQLRETRNTLDAANIQLQGDLFKLPGGMVTAVLGVEWRNETQKQTASATPVAITQFAVPVFTYGLSGSVNVKEAYGELAAPLLDIADTVKIDVNGAARYSDYSNTGEIWSWKAGGTVRLFGDLLLRGLRSRDIRSPSIDPELFTPQAINMSNLSKDFQSDDYSSKPGYLPNPAITTYTGGNPNLRPEVARTLTYGATYSPSFLSGLSLSADYYDIRIDSQIATLAAPALTQACSLGNAAACSSIVRDPTTGSVTTAYINFQNLAYSLLRGYDFEASLVKPLTSLGINLPGALRVRGLVNYTLRSITNNGVVTNSGSTANAGRWRGRLSVAYQSDSFGFDVRLRHIAGGLINYQDVIVTNATTGITTGLIDNRRDAFTYVDLGLQFRVQDRFTLFGNVNNLFNKAAPLETQQSGTYDHVGTYFTAGARVKF